MVAVLHSIGMFCVTNLLLVLIKPLQQLLLCEIKEGTHSTVPFNHSVKLPNI